jgi:hypothetical protein
VDSHLQGDKEAKYMAKSGTKTTKTEVSVDDFVAAVTDEQQRLDAIKIIDMMARVSGHPPTMWGPSIIGFGQYHYRYDSGREGTMCRIGFSPRKGQTVLYILEGFQEYTGILSQLGKFKTGKSCLYVKRLSDVDETLLEDLCARSLDWMAEKYPDQAVTSQ